jgi:hypothetical protein
MRKLKVLNIKQAIFWKSGNWLPLALEYSTRVVQEGGRRCKKSTLNDLVHLTPLRIPLMNPPIATVDKKVYIAEGLY